MTSKIVVNNIEADSGINTITFINEVTAPTFNGNIVGTAATFSGNVDIAGALTYEDVTNVDSVGIITARSGVRVTGGSVGISTNSITANTNADDLQIGSRTDGIERGITIASSLAGSLRFADDGNDTAGWMYYSHSDNSLRLGANGSEKLRITSAGLVGIGTETPNHGISLHQSGTGTFDAINFITGNTNANGYQMGINSSGEVFHWNTTNSSIQFATNNTERVRIKSNGEVRQQSTGGSTIYELKRSDSNTTGSVGTINFTASDDHSVASIGAMGDGDNEGAHLVFRTTSAAANNSPYNAATPERLRITSGGNVGIGTDDPFSTNGTNLEVAHHTSSGACRLLLRNTNGSGLRYYIQSQNDGALTFGDISNGERLRINSAGQLLHTRSDNTTRYDLEFRQTGGITDGNYSGIHWTQSATGSTNLAAIEIEYASTGRPDIVFKTRQSGGTAMSEAARIDSVGRFRIANQPAWNLRPNASSTQSTSAGSNVIGWSDNTTGSSSTVCFLKGGVTLSGSTGSTSHNGSSTGRINVPVAGTYKVWCTIRCENTPGAGNIYLRVNGTTIARQHVEVWARYNYAHGFHSHILNLTANSYIEWIVTINAGSHNISGYNDTVNWTGGHLIG